MLTMNPDHEPLPSHDASTEGSPEDVLAPETLVLRGQAVVSGTDTAKMLYRMNWNITSIPQKSSSVIFERVKDDLLLENEDPTPTKQRDEHIFYLAHPAGAKYQKETPEYYLTSVSPESLGNISLETSKPGFRKTEFRMLLSAGRTWSDKPLFEEDAETLFEVKPKWMSSRYTWTNRTDEQVAYEDKKEDERILVTLVSMERKLRDALVATWCLRLWYETAESTRAQRDEMERLTPAKAMHGYTDLKTAKRTGALGSLGGAGA
ncbi:uncharacterized protein GGS22DRAFT_94154 [Annulohypoxylon maeteangense]|uniref:uncharacterized protein n=1 Tax=Annulohypoxylon maeteangense TaxID=1927788 RepID=UPI002007879A|nr:uncharacterized protein GGS22DRAFT_94154 [Annulohypoxylon maeteangense]KAI0888171.1 hypothetical protein GGS22DRAFT_94154 [Annulohypoxylon maeteangense]